MVKKLAPLEHAEHTGDSRENPFYNEEKVFKAVGEYGPTAEAMNEEAGQMDRIARRHARLKKVPISSMVSHQETVNGDILSKSCIKAMQSEFMEKPRHWWSATQAEAHYIIDGNHRLLADKMAGKSYAPVRDIVIHKKYINGHMQKSES